MRRLIITVLSLAAIAAVALGATQLVSGNGGETATAEKAQESAAPEQTLTVFASPTCGCCGDCCGCCGCGYC